MTDSRICQPRLAVGLMALVALALVAGCTGAPKTRAEYAERGDKVVIGVVWPWQDRRELLFGEGLDLALAEINAAGGIKGRPVELRREDDHQSVNEGRLVAQTLANDQQVLAVIGHLQSHVTVPAAAIYDHEGLLLLAPAATSPELTTKSYQRVFRGTFTDTLVGKRLADYVVAQGYQRLAIYYVRSIYGRTLANAFEERLASARGVQILARDSYEPVDQVRGEMIEPALERWSQLELDAIFLAGEVPSAGGVIKAIRESGLQVPIIGGDAMSSPALWEVGGDAVAGTVVASFFHPDEPRAEVKRFVEAFRAKFGKTPDAGAVLAYDALQVLAAGLRAAPSLLPDDVARALRSMPAHQGVTGPFTFDERGELKERPIPLSVVRDRQFHFMGLAGSDP